MLNLVFTHMQHNLGIRVENQYVFHALGKVEIRADFQILEFVALADDFDNRFRNVGDGFILFVGFAAKNRNVGTFERSVRETHVDSGYVHAFASVRMAAGNSCADAVDGFLAFVEGLRLPQRDAADDFKAYAEFVGGK